MKISKAFPYIKILENEFWEQIVGLKMAAEILLNLTTKLKVYKLIW